MSDTDINWLYVQFYLNEEDLVQLKYRENTATSENNTFVENTVFLIEDMNNNRAAIRSENNRLQASTVWPDVTPPTLDDFISV